MSDDRLSCISCGQSIDNLTSLSLRLARTNVSLGLLVSRLWSERHKVSAAFACCPVWLLTYSLYDKSKSSCERQRENLRKYFLYANLMDACHKTLCQLEVSSPPTTHCFSFHFPCSSTLPPFLSVILPLPLYVSLTANCNEI